MFLPSLVHTDIRTDPSCDDELITFASMRRDAVGDLVEGQEPHAIDDLASVANFFVWVSVVVSDKTKPHIGHIALCDDLGISREIPDSDKRETVH
jgi:hypothetical protein